MARFDEKVVLVTGASGRVGGGIARQFLLEGAKVIAPVRSSKSAESVVEHVGPAGPERLEVFVSDVADDESGSAAAESLKSKYGDIDHVVSCAGGWWQGGELSEQSQEEVQKQLNNYAVSHFLYFKHFAPLLKDDAASSFLFISGSAGSDYMPKLSLVTVGASALFGVSVAARGEYKDKAVRVNECRLASFVLRHEDAAPEGKPFSNYAMGKVVADVAASGTSGEIVIISDKELSSAEITE